MSNRAENSVHLISSHPTGNAFAAGFGHAKVHKVSSYVHHARALIHDDHAAGTHNGTCLRQRLILDWHIEVFIGQAPARRAAGLDGFEFPTLGNTTTDVEDHLA